MLIDWFTVIAQVINFLILIYLLNRFLYKPLTKTMAERQRRIEARWQDAERQREMAQEEAATYRQKQQELEADRDRQRADAREQAAQERRHLIQQARREVDQLQTDWRTAVEREQDSFLQQLQQQIVQQIDTIVRRIFNDLSNADLEQHIISTFLERLQKLNESEVQNLSESQQKHEDQIQVFSSFDLPQATRQKIAQTLRQKNILNHCDLNFKTDSRLICGIELHLSGYEIAWNIDHYLTHLDETLATLLREPEDSPHGRTQITSTNRA